MDGCTSPPVRAEYHIVGVDVLVKHDPRRIDVLENMGRRVVVYSIESDPNVHSGPNVHSDPNVDVLGPAIVDALTTPRGRRISPAHPPRWVRWDCPVQPEGDRGARAGISAQVTSPTRYFFWSE